jgi:hypothetical protein
MDCSTRRSGHSRLDGQRKRLPRRSPGQSCGSGSYSCRRFLVLPGHEIRELERVIGEGHRFHVVEKPEDVADMVEEEGA